MLSWKQMGKLEGVQIMPWNEIIELVGSSLIRENSWAPRVWWQKGGDHSEVQKTEASASVYPESPNSRTPLLEHRPSSNAASRVWSEISSISKPPTFFPSCFWNLWG